MRTFCLRSQHQQTMWMSSCKLYRREEGSYSTETERGEQDDGTLHTPSTRALKPDSLDSDPRSGFNVVSRELHTALRLLALHCRTHFTHAARNIPEHCHAAQHPGHSMQLGSVSRPCGGLKWSLNPDPRRASHRIWIQGPVWRVPMSPTTTCASGRGNIIERWYEDGPRSWPPFYRPVGAHVSPIFNFWKEFAFSTLFLTKFSALKTQNFWIFSPKTPHFSRKPAPLTLLLETRAAHTLKEK